MNAAKSSAAPATLYKVREDLGAGQLAEYLNAQAAEGYFRDTVLIEAGDREHSSRYSVVLKRRESTEKNPAHQALYEALSAAGKALSAIRRDVLPLLGDLRIRDFHEEVDAARAALALADAAKEGE